MKRPAGLRVTKLKQGVDGLIDPVLQVIDGSMVSIKARFRRKGKSAKEVYLVEWRGNKRIPRNTIVGEISIWFLDHGLAKDMNRVVVAKYERLVKFGGFRKSEQKILMFFSQKNGTNQ